MTDLLHDLAKMNICQKSSDDIPSKPWIHPVAPAQAGAQAGWPLQALYPSSDYFPAIALFHAFTPARAPGTWPLTLSEEWLQMIVPSGAMI